MAPTDCLMCAALPYDLKCTLHGGHMTATEVRIRDKLEISKGKWIERPARPSRPFEALIDAKLQFLRQMGLIRR